MIDSNKVSLNQIKICSNQINSCIKSNKIYLWPDTNAIICFFLRKIYLIQTNIYLAQKYFFKLRKCYLIQINLFFESKKASQTNYFLSFNQIFVLSLKSAFTQRKVWLIQHKFNSIN